MIGERASSRRSIDAIEIQRMQTGLKQFRPSCIHRDIRIARDYVLFMIIRETRVYEQVSLLVIVRCVSLGPCDRHYIRADFSDFVDISRNHVPEGLAERHLREEQFSELTTSK